MSRVALVVKYMNYYGFAIFYSAYNNYSAIEYASIVALRAKYEFSKVIIIIKIKRMINSNITAMREPHARTATPTATARLGLASDRAYRRFGPKLRCDARFSRRIWRL